jgi:hypothetical protein
VARSDSLWTDVFKGPRSILHTGDWIDRPSVGIPYLYVATGVELAEALKGEGQNAQALSVFRLSKQVANTVRLGDLVRQADSEFEPPLAPGDTARAATIPTPPPAPSAGSAKTATTATAAPASGKAARKRKK